MKFTAQLLSAASLLSATGCAKTDWIDRTLVTVDVTGLGRGSSEQDQEPVLGMSCSSWSKTGEW